MNQTSRTILNSSSTHLFDELNFKHKFNSFDSWTKFNELITESSLELFSSWFGSLPALIWATGKSARSNNSINWNASQHKLLISNNKNIATCKK